MESEHPDPGEHEERERLRRRLERVLPEVIKRAVETGFEKITEGPENVRQLVSDMKLPKEALTLILSQIDETKNGLYRVVAKEIRDFLEHTNFSEEMAKALTMLSFEIKTEVRFIPNDSRAGAVPSVKSKVKVRRSDAPSEPPENEEEEEPAPEMEDEVRDDPPDEETEP